MKAIYSIFIVIVAAALLAGCGKSTQPSADAVATPVDNVTALKQAVQSFKTQEGHFPKALDELAPKYIAKIPDAPAGFKFVYTPATGELKVSR
jgi:ABC-type glycerol-3-phosphate transport system substrate-binding protein